MKNGMANLLAAKLVVTCPRSDSPVDARTDCVNCKSFKHVAYKGMRPFIACTYKKKPNPEKKGIGGLRRW